jgi:hypothetical protein
MHKANARQPDKPVRKRAFSLAHLPGSLIRFENAGRIIAGRHATERLRRRVHSLDGLSLVPWSRRFVDPIPTKGKPIVTLQDAAQFILKLSKAEQSKPHWQAAAEAVIMAAEDRGPLMHADIGMKRALNAGRPAPAHILFA